MKKSLLKLTVFLLLSLHSLGGNAPAAVIKAFDQKFPNATSVKWGKENAHEYEAEFEWKGAMYSANFSDKGEWLETESPVNFDQLPEKVKSAFSLAHKDESIKACSKIESSKGETKYEVEIKQGLKTIELIYAADGSGSTE